MLTSTRPLTTVECKNAVNQLYHNTINNKNTDNVKPTHYVFHVEWSKQYNHEIDEKLNDNEKSTVKPVSRRQRTVYTSVTKQHTGDTRTMQQYIDTELQHAHQVSVLSKPTSYLPRLCDVPNKTDLTPGIGQYDIDKIDKNRHIPTVNLLPNTRSELDMYGHDDDKGPGFYHTIKLQYNNKLKSEKYTRVDFSRTTSREHAIIGLQRQNNDIVSDSNYNCTQSTSHIKGGVFNTSERVQSAPLARQRLGEHIYDAILPSKDTRNRHKWSMTPRFTYGNKTEHIKALASTYRQTINQGRPATRTHISNKQQVLLNDNVVIDSDCHTFITNIQSEQQCVVTAEQENIEIDNNMVQQSYKQLDSIPVAVDYDLYHRQERQRHLDAMDHIVNRDKYIELERQRKRDQAAAELAQKQLLLLISVCSRLQYCTQYIQRQRQIQSIHVQRMHAAISIQCWYRYLKHRHITRKQAIAIHVIVRVLRYNVIKQKVQRKRHNAALLFSHLYDVAVRLNTVKLVRRLTQHAVTIQRWYRKHLTMKEARIKALTYRWRHIELLVCKQYTITYGNALWYEARKKSALPKKMTAAQQRQHYMQQVTFEYISDFQRHKQLTQQYNLKSGVYNKHLSTQYRTLQNKQKLQLLEAQADNAALLAGTNVNSPTSITRTFQVVPVYTAPFVWVLTVSQICQSMHQCYNQLNWPKEQVTAYKAAMAKVVMNRNKSK